jgi:hypothetical protein
MKKDEYIYIIRDTVKVNIYKIGISNEPRKRICNLQTGNPNKIEIIFELKVNSDISARKVENIIHNFLKENNMWISGEWFKIENPEYIIQLAKSMLSIGKNRKN